MFPLFFFFNDTATTEIYTLSLHDALPISQLPPRPFARYSARSAAAMSRASEEPLAAADRSEEHTSELQSRPHLVCRLLLEKKKNSENCLQQSAKTKWTADTIVRVVSVAGN